MSIKSSIKYFKNKIKRTLFTTPSHNQGAFIIPEAKKLLGEKIFQADYSEIEGFDNLANPEGIIKDLHKKIANIYEAKHSFCLTNGSTSGILALMLSTLKPKDKVLLARNCHKAVYNGLVLTGAYPVWLETQIDKDWGIVKPPSLNTIEQALEQNSNIKVLILTNPTYEGLFVDIKQISTICKKNNIILIVDEAHGALWNFIQDNSFIPAIKNGADASFQSLHKTAGALNPCALLHLAKDSLIEPQKVQEALNLITTTSPSYPLLANIEITVEFLNSKKGEKYILNLIKNINEFRRNLLAFDNLHVYYFENDFTKLLIQVDELSGYELELYLLKKFNIEVELANNNCVLLLCGVGTTKEKLNKLFKALVHIAKKPKYLTLEKTNPLTINIKPITALTPQIAYYADSEDIDYDKVIGRIAKKTYMEYPPGIPVLLSGELIQEEHLEFLSTLDEKISVIKQ